MEPHRIGQTGCQIGARPVRSVAFLAVGASQEQAAAPASLESGMSAGSVWASVGLAHSSDSRMGAASSSKAWCQRNLQ